MTTSIYTTLLKFTALASLCGMLINCGGGSAPPQATTTADLSVSGLALGTHVELRASGLASQPADGVGSGPATYSLRNADVVTLPTVAQGALYSVDVPTQPDGQYCAVVNGAGTAASAPVHILAVCHALINLATTGLADGTSVGLTLSGSGPNTPTSTGTNSAVTQADGAITVTVSNASNPLIINPTLLDPILTVSAPPAGQFCGVTYGASLAPISVTVACHPQLNLSATGLKSGTSVVLDVVGAAPAGGGIPPGASDIAPVVSGNNSYTITLSNSSNTLAGLSIASPQFTVHSQPAGQLCKVLPGTGTAPVTVVVACVDR